MKTKDLWSYPRGIHSAWKYTYLLYFLYTSRLFPIAVDLQQIANGRSFWCYWSKQDYGHRRSRRSTWWSLCSTPTNPLQFGAQRGWAPTNPLSTSSFPVGGTSPHPLPARSKSKVSQRVGSSSRVRKAKDIQFNSHKSQAREKDIFYPLTPTNCD